MRRIVFVLILGLIAVPAVLAQRGGGGHGGGGSHGGGGGFHAGGSAGFRGGSAGFRGGFNGAFHGNTGFRGNVGFRSNFAFRNNFAFRTRFGFSPFWYGGFYGGYPSWDPFLDYSDYGYPDYGYASNAYPYDGSYGSNSPWYPPPQYYTAPTPPPPAPVIKEYNGPPSQAQSNEPPLYLLAFSDGVIRAVLAYWVDGTTLHYVSMEHEQKQVPLSTVDRTLSERLNRERNVTFQLPR
jgi:hypothetical protein